MSYRSHAFLSALEYQERRKCPQTCNRNSKVDFILRSQFLPESLVSLPSGFRAIAEEGQLSPGLFKVLLRVSRWINLINDCEKSKNISTIMELQPWIDVENIVSCLKAEEARRPVASLSLPRTTAEKVVSLTLFCLCVYILRRFSSSGVFQYMLAELMDSIELYEPQSEPQIQLQVWAATVASGIADEGAPLSPRSSRLVDFLVERSPDLVRGPHLAVILRRFLVFNTSLVAWTAGWRRGLERQRASSGVGMLLALGAG